MNSVGRPLASSTVGRSGAVIAVGAWGAAGVGLAVLGSQLTGWNRVRLIAIAQSLTPAIAVGGVPVAAAGVVLKQRLLAAAGVATAIGLGAIVCGVGDSVGRRVRRDPIGPSLSIAHANLLFLNTDRAAESIVAVLATGADILALSELTVHHERALIDQGAGDQYPFRFGRPAKRSEGIAVWSKLPFVDVRREYMESRPGIVATVETAGGDVRIVFAHPDPPTSRRGLRHWAPSLERIGRIAELPGPPTVIIADLNASRWHPAFRRLLGAGWADAHESFGRGLSTSWPTNARVLAPFIRLDHALVGAGLEVVSVVDFDVPGSDHRGFVVSVSPESPCTRVAPTPAETECVG